MRRHDRTTRRQQRRSRHAKQRFLKKVAPIWKTHMDAMWETMFQPNVIIEYLKRSKNR